MAVLKKLILIFFIPLHLLASNYTYLIDEYTKETELEAKIVTKIAKDILMNKPVKLYIPQKKQLDQKIYSKSTLLVNSCKEANFIFVKYHDPVFCSDKKANQYLLTNNYKKLISDPSYFGAFFWSKSRPNIVLIKQRLIKNNIRLSSEYDQFIEDF